MKNPGKRLILQKFTAPRLTARLVVTGIFAALFLATSFQAALAQTAACTNSPLPVIDSFSPTTAITPSNCTMTWGAHHREAVAADDQAGCKQGANNGVEVCDPGNTTAAIVAKTSRH